MSRTTVGMYCGASALCSVGVSMIVTVYSLYLEAGGLTKAEANLVNAAFFTAMFLLEVPTGVFADVFGRKLSFVASCWIYGLGMMTYSFQSCFWGFILAEIVCALGATFGTGAFEAWFVDQMKHEGATEEAIQSAFRTESQLSAVAGPIAAIVGAVLYSWHPSLPWFVGGVVYFLVGVLALVLIREDYFRFRRYDTSRVRAILRKTIRVSLREAKNNAAVKVVLLLLLVQLIGVQSPNMQWALCYRDLAGVGSLGYLWLAISLSVACGARVSVWLRSHTQNSLHALRLMQSATGVTLVFAGALLPVLPMSFLLFLVHEVARGAFGPIQRGYLNEATPSRVRATVLSFTSLASRFGSATGLLVGGILVERLGMSLTWQVSGIFLVLATLIIVRK